MSIVQTNTMSLEYFKVVPYHYGSLQNKHIHKILIRSNIVIDNCVKVSLLDIVYTILINYVYMSRRSEI